MMLLTPVCVCVCVLELFIYLKIKYLFNISSNSSKSKNNFYGSFKISPYFMFAFAFTIYIEKVFVCMGVHVFKCFYLFIIFFCLFFCFAFPFFFFLFFYNVDVVVVVVFVVRKFNVEQEYVSVTYTIYRNDDNSNNNTIKPKY